MEPSKYSELSNKILDDPKERYCEIYKITNIVNQKKYIGQAVSHILNHKKYRPYGKEGRFRCHISEAYSKKKNQCHYLNNAIQKYGVENFEIDLMECCSIVDANEREIFHILQENSIFPHGYNLKIGGNQFTHSEESKKRVSHGVFRYFKNKKIERFRGVQHINEDVETYIKPLRRDNIQYGWYVYIDSKKADFGGVHISLEESKKCALDFIEQIKQNISIGNASKLLEVP